MSTIRGAVEQSRERLVALVLLLQRAWEYGALTQDQILRDLTVDEYPVTAKGPRKIRAYEGADGTVRQKFERDKAKIRDLGFEIDTVALDDGAVGYRIDPSSGYAPPISFTPDEERVVKLALRFCGFGRSGAFSVFNEVPASDGGLEASYFYTPVLRALNLRRTLTFGYLSGADKVRRVEPLAIEVFSGATYLVGRVGETGEIKGYRFSRMTSMPELLADTFVVDDETLAIAQAWRPEYAKSPRPFDVIVATNEDYAELLVRQFPSAVTATKGSGRVEVAVSFESPRAALRFVLECADRVRLISPKSLKSELRTWLSEVNRSPAPNVKSVKFDASSTRDVLGETLQLLHAVYLAEDGLSVSELARRFSLSTQHVRFIMDRLVSLEPMARATDGTNTFPAHVVKECDDWDNEDDDAIYRADFSDLAAGAEDPSPFMWRDLFELNISLREASRMYSDPAVQSAIEKIERVTSESVHVEMAANEPLLGEIDQAIAHHAQIKIEYASGVSQRSQARVIEPREVRVLNGHTYVRAYCTTRRAWRTFRVDRIRAVLASSPSEEPRPLDDHDNWLTRVGDEGDAVVVVLEPWARWLFEPVPGAQWSLLDDGRHAVRFRVTDRTFVDYLMLRAGPDASVATPKYADAGHELARRIASQI